MDKRAKIAAVYNVFACAMLIPTLWIIPRMVESLHPGGQGVEGNPAIEMEKILIQQCEWYFGRQLLAGPY